VSTVLRTLLVGRRRHPLQRPLLAGLAVVLFFLSLSAYATGLATVSGGVVWVPGHAALIGVAAGFGVGFARGGLLFAWLASYASLLGFFAYGAAIEAAEGDLVERVGSLVRVDALVFFGVEAVLFGTVAFVLGSVGGWGVRYITD
jgi:apolipoprotein N-acyltransferase